METKCSWYSSLFSVLLLSTALNFKAAAQEQAEISKDEIPITTSVLQVKEKYIEGIRFIENFQYGKARSSFLEAVQTDPEFALGYLGLARAADEFPEARQNFEKAQDMVIDLSEGEKLLVSFYKAQFEGNITKTKNKMEKLLELFPKDKQVQFLSGKFEFTVNRSYNTAMLHFRKALEIDENYAPAYNELGMLYMMKNDFKNAERTFKKYITLAPDNPGSYDSYAHMLLIGGRLDESMEQYKKALSIEPAFEYSLQGSGNIYLFKGDFTKARESYQEIFDKTTLANWKLTALYDQAVSYVREGDIKSALSTLESEILIAESQGSVTEVVNAYNSMGFILTENGKPEEAMKHFDMASEKIENSNLPGKLRDNLAADVNLCKLYTMAASGRSDRAGAMLEDKEQITGGYNDLRSEKFYQNVMGYISFKQDKYDDAISYYSRADDQNPLVWYYTALAYEKKGDIKRSAQLIDKIRKSTDNSLALAIAYNLAKATVAQTE